jgi:hypothetical protein
MDKRSLSLWVMMLVAACNAPVDSTTGDPGDTLDTSTATEDGASFHYQQAGGSQLVTRMVPVDIYFGRSQGTNYSNDWIDVNPLNHTDWLGKSVQVTASQYGHEIAMGQETITQSSVHSEFRPGTRDGFRAPRTLYWVTVPVNLPDGLVEGTPISFEVHFVNVSGDTMKATYWTRPDSTLFGDRIRVRVDDAQHITFTGISGIAHSNLVEDQTNELVLGQADSAITRIEDMNWDHNWDTSMDFRPARAFAFWSANWSIDPSKLLGLDTLELRLFEDYDRQANTGGSFKNRYCFKNVVTANGATCPDGMSCPLEPVGCPSQ